LIEIKHKRSATLNAVPAAADLVLGEIAINTIGGQMFIKKDNGAVVEVGGSDAENDAKFVRRAGGSTMQDVVDVGTTVVVLTGTSIDLAISNGFKHTYTANWSPVITNASNGRESSFLIELVDGGAWATTWSPVVNWVSPDGSTNTNLLTAGVELQTSGSDWAIIWTPDGVTFYGKVIR